MSMLESLVNGTGARKAPVVEAITPDELVADAKVIQELIWKLEKKVDKSKVKHWIKSQSKVQQSLGMFINIVKDGMDEQTAMYLLKG